MEKKTKIIIISSIVIILIAVIVVIVLRMNKGNEDFTQNHKDQVSRKDLFLKNKDVPKDITETEKNWFRNFDNWSRNHLQNNINNDLENNNGINVNKVFSLPGLKVDSVDVLDNMFVFSIQVKHSDSATYAYNSKKFICNDNYKLEEYLEQMCRLMRSSLTDRHPKVILRRVVKVTSSPFDNNFLNSIRDSTSIPNLDVVNNKIIYHVMVPFYKNDYFINEEDIKIQANFKDTVKKSFDIKYFEAYGLLNHDRHPGYYFLKAKTFTNFSNWKKGGNNDFYDKTTLGKFYVNNKNKDVDLELSHTRDKFAKLFEKHVKEVFEKNPDNIYTREYKKLLLNQNVDKIIRPHLEIIRQKMSDFRTKVRKELEIKKSDIRDARRINNNERNNNKKNNNEKNKENNNERNDDNLRREIRRNIRQGIRNEETREEICMGVDDEVCDKVYNRILDRL